MSVRTSIGGDGLPVPALTELAVSLYLANETRGVTTHEFALSGLRCRQRRNGGRIDTAIFAR